MFVLGLKEISAELRVKWNGRETSAKLHKMTVAEYKEFLVKAEAFAGIPNPDKDHFLFLRADCKYDFIRFLVNEHSFLSMVFADRLHPYSKWERLVSFFILNSTMLTLLIFVASGHAFKKDHTTTASNNEPTQTDLALYEYFILAPIRVVVSFILYYILAAPFDRRWSDRARFWTNMGGHLFMVVGSLGGLYALWEASMVIKVAADELQENLPGFLYSVMICGNVCEVILIYLKFVDLGEDSPVPLWARTLLIVSERITCGTLAIGQWHKQNLVQIEHGYSHSRQAVSDVSVEAGACAIAPPPQEIELPPAQDLALEDF